MEPREIMNLEEEYTKIFDKYFRNFQQRFPDVLTTIRKNSYASATRRESGRIWFIGGFVYRPILNALYGIPLPPETDIDVLIERGPGKMSTDSLKKDRGGRIFIPKGWNCTITQSGVVSIFQRDVNIDLNYLLNFPSIYAKHPNDLLRMEHFFECTPLDIQAMAYTFRGDIEKRVMGDAAIESVHKRLIRILNIDAVKFEVEKHNRNAPQEKMITEEQFVQAKAKELQVEYKLSDRNIEYLLEREEKAHRRTLIISREQDDKTGFP